VHAVALVNVCEMTSGLALLTGLPDGVRGIVTGLSIDYLHKARGTIRAVSRVSIPEVSGDLAHEVSAECFDGQSRVVARARVRWRLGPVR
jgi:acyl-coenzyme A thioesterase PaaI-like protein